MLTFFITNVCKLECLTDRHMQESRKNHQNCLMSLQFEMLYRIIWEVPVEHLYF